MAGRNALVIGGGRGIGRAVSLALAEEGARVLAVGRSADSLADLLAVARARSLPIQVARGDASRADRVRSFLAAAAAGTPRDRAGARRAAYASAPPASAPRAGAAPDILVVAAGDYWEGPLARLSAEQWEALARSNVSLPLTAIRLALPGMRRRRYGRILLFGVAGGDMPRAAPRAHAYRAAKVALLTLARSVAAEEAANGITVNTILPGIIRTWTSRARDAELSRRIPAGRLGSPREVARAALFLLGEESGYITGAALPISGGYLI